MIKTLFAFLRYAFTMIFFISALLMFVRFGGPTIQACSVMGRAATQKVNCFQLVEFTGSDILSIYRIKIFIN